MNTPNNGARQLTDHLSNDESGLITTALHALGLPQEQIEALTAKVHYLAHRPAEDIVLGREPVVPLASRESFFFGVESDEHVTVRLPILGGDYLWSTFLPAFEEWVTTLYRGRTLDLLQQAALNPLPFVLDTIQKILRRPADDELKWSVYETAATTFSRPEAVITAEFFAKCPPNQQMGSIRKLVEINRENFTELWAEMPTPLKFLYSSLRTASMLSIERLSGQLLGSILEMTEDASLQLRSSGGPDVTGIADSGPLPAAMLPPSTPFIS